MPWPTSGSEFEKRYWKTNAMTMPEITIGITKTVRRAAPEADHGT